MKTLSIGIFLLFAVAAQAHEGHDHGAAAQPVAGSVAPRFEARSELFEVVGILQGEELVLYLDHAGDNSPVLQAEIEIESGTFKGTAATDGSGEFRLAAGALSQPATHALTLTIQTDTEADLLTATFEHATLASTPAAGSFATLLGKLVLASPTAYGLAGGLLLLVALLTRRLMKRKQACD